MGKPFCLRLEEATYFDSPKMVTIQNRPLAFCYRLLQLCVLSYIVVISLWLNGGYLEYFPVSGYLAAYVDENSVWLWDEHNFTNPIDMSDFVLQQGGHSIVLAVSWWEIEQTKGICLAPGQRCYNNSDCLGDEVTHDGVVVPDSCNLTAGFCNVHSWCPNLHWLDYTNFSEPKTVVDPESLENMRVFIQTTRFLSRYQGEWNPGATDIIVYPLQDLWRNWPDALTQGGQFSILTNYQCNLDQTQGGPFDSCTSTVSYVPENITAPTSSTQISIQSTRPGVRLTKYSTQIRLDFAVTGQAWVFSAITLFITLGSGLSYFVALDFFTDCFLQYLHSKKERYNNKKFSSLTLTLAEEVPLLDPTEGEEPKQFVPVLSLTDTEDSGLPEPHQFPTPPINEPKWEEANIQILESD
jgi:hypothetical protein